MVGSRKPRSYNTSAIPTHMGKSVQKIKKETSLAKLFPRQVAQVLFYPQLTVMTHVCVGDERVVCVVASLVEPEAIQLRELG